MATEYKVTLLIKKKKKVWLDAVYVTTESMARAKKIAQLNRPGMDVLSVKPSDR